MAGYRKGRAMATRQLPIISSGLTAGAPHTALHDSRSLKRPVFTTVPETFNPHWVQVHLRITSGRPPLDRQPQAA